MSFLNTVSGKRPFVAATVSFAASAVDTTDASGYTFSGHAIGTAATNRKVVVGVKIGNNAPAVTVTGLTVGGVSASSVVTLQVNDEERVEIWQASVATGTTADVVVTLSAAANRLGIGTWAVYGAATAAADTGSSTANPMSDTLTFSAGGVVIAVAGTLGTATHSWTGITERYDQTVETATGHSGASDAFATAQSGLAITCTSSNPAAGDGMVCAAWVP